MKTLILAVFLSARPASAADSGLTKPPSKDSGVDFSVYKGKKKLKFPKKVNDLDAKGIGYLAQGKYKGAVNAFDKSLKLMPRNARALANRGTAWEKLGDPDKALSDYGKAISISPEVAPALVASLSAAHLARGRKRVDAGKIEDALQDFYTAIQLDGKNAAAYSEVAFAAYRTGKYDTCVSYASHALEADKNFSDAYGNRGACLYGLGKKREALQDLDSAILIDPKHAPFYASRAGIRAGLEQYKEAVQDGRKAADLDASLKAQLAPMIEDWSRKAPH